MGTKFSRPASVAADHEAQRYDLGIRQGMIKIFKGWIQADLVIYGSCL